MIMKVSEAKNVIRDINECQHTLDLLIEHEKEPYYKSSFKCNKKLLEEYKMFLLEQIENAELKLNFNGGKKCMEDILTPRSLRKNIEKNMNYM